MNFDDNYFNDTYQGIPIGGYTNIFKSLLQDCDLALGEDFFKNRAKWESMAKRIVFTGKIDEYFDYEHGELDYRTLHFEHTTQNGDYQGNAVVNYTDIATPFTRITEHKYFQPQALEKTSQTIWTKEFPAEWNKDSTPFYPIGDEKNNSKYRKYKENTTNIPNTIFGGRLAEYKYYDMHQVIGSALQKSRSELGA